MLVTLALTSQQSLHTKVMHVWSDLLLHFLVALQANTHS